MCGIAGALTLNKNDINVVKNILDYQFNRGPDFSKIDTVYFSRYIFFLGHNRLTINDLSEFSNQPFWDFSKRYCITYNGEIYNFKELKKELTDLGCIFFTTGDTEVLLASLIFWGEKALSKLNGMFAFCFVDTLKGSAIIARDRFAKKPLYYHYSNDRFIFASTPTIIAKTISARPNINYLLNGLNYWTYENGSDYSQYENIFCLTGGGVIKININSDNILFEKFNYYDLSKNIGLNLITPNLTFEEAQKGTLELYQNSISLRLRSDVPVALSLSGGLDSSSIAAIAKQMNSEIQGVTFGHPDAKNSEGPVVQRLGRHLDINVNYVWPSMGNIIDAFEKSFDAQDSPLISPSYLAEFLVYETAQKLGFKVMLGGQGGDEVFMGYRKYQFYSFLDHLKSYNLIDASKQGVNLLSIFKNEIYQLRAYLNSMKRYTNGNNNSILNFNNVNNPSNNFNLGEMSQFSRQIIDIMNISVPTQIKSEDRNSMANSIETRAPLLDYRLVEYGVSLPTKFKVNRGYGKWIIREMMKGVIPEEIRMAKFKRGFDVSQDWIGLGLGNHLRQRLFEKDYLIKEFLKKGIKIDIFTDQYFRKNKSAFQEATTLIWLSNRV